MKKQLALFLTFGLFLLMIGCGVVNNSTGGSTTTAGLTHGTVTLTADQCWDVLNEQIVTWTASVGQISYTNYQSGHAFKFELVGDKWEDVTNASAISNPIAANPANNEVTTLDNRINDLIAIMWEPVSPDTINYFGVIKVLSHVSIPSENVGTVNVEYWGNPAGGVFSLQ